MFEIGFSEILLVAFLALLVLGPEKLPKVAAQLGRWTGRARNMARQLRMQLEQEVSYEELMKDKQRAEAELASARAAMEQPLDAPLNTSAEPASPAPSLQHGAGAPDKSGTGAAS